MSSDAFGGGRGVAGILLAAGRARRMGRLKQLLPWPREGPGTVVAAAFDCIAAFVEEVFVVVDRPAPEVIDALAGRRFNAVESDGGAPMFDSVRAGLEAVRAHGPSQAVVIHPADHPHAPAAVVAGLVERVLGGSAAQIPTCRGRGGHPVAVPWSLVDPIVNYGGARGLAGFWRANPGVVRRVECGDPWVVTDLDTPDSYREAVARADRARPRSNS